MNFKTSASACILALSLQYQVSAQTQANFISVTQPIELTPALVAPSNLVSAQAGRIALDQGLLALANVVCHEEIARYARRGKTITRTDTLELNVEVLNGIEKYWGIRRKQTIYPDVPNLPGTWSTGELATLLVETRAAIEHGDVQIGQDETADFGRSTVLTFSNPETRRWYLKANSHTHWLPVRGRVWTSPATGDIRRISWFARDLPTQSGVAQVLWTVDFSPVNISNLVVSLPQKALYQITYTKTGDHIDWNVTKFSAYRRYGSATEIHFDN